MKFHDTGALYSAVVNNPESLEYRPSMHYINAVLTQNNLQEDWDTYAIRGFNVGIHVK